MQLNPELSKDLSLALNEATISDVNFNKDLGQVAITIHPILANNGTTQNENENSLVLIIKSVSRFAASYRLGRWDDENAEVAVLKPEQIHQNIKEFQPFEIYGQQFIDGNEGYFEKSETRLSFNYLNNHEPTGKHTFEFSRDSNNYLSVKIWFNELELIDAKGHAVNIEKFIASNKKAWKSQETLSSYGIHTLPSDKKG